MLARAARKETEQAQRQPVRRWFDDPLNPWIESELGRFCLVHKLRREIVEAGRDWYTTVRLWRVAWGAPMDEHHGGAGGGFGPSEATVRAWREAMLRVEEALYGEDGRNKARYLAAKLLCLDDKPVPRELTQHAIDGLRVVAVELGKMTERMAPFHEDVD